MFSNIPFIINVVAAFLGILFVVFFLFLAAGHGWYKAKYAARMKLLKLQAELQEEVQEFQQGMVQFIKELEAKKEKRRAEEAEKEAAAKAAKKKK